ncbi:MAG TPA: DUF4405 domain-containing protein, partial [Fibrobacteria bacterium]|nr:DUF4405 domain-containing protein [Fibrobacteria bacterium]
MNARTIATPLTIAAFLAVGITGLCMLLDLKGGYVKGLHELAGILMVLASVLHVWVNRVLLVKHLKSWVGAVLAVAALVLVIVAVVGPGKSASVDRGGMSRRLVETAMGAELKRVAILAGKTPSQAVTQLRGKGLVV